MKTISIGERIQDLESLLETKPDTLGEWSCQFIEDMVSKSNAGRVTTHLSEKQVEKIEEIWSEHFA
jgi:hypothetical protein